MSLRRRVKHRATRQYLNGNPKPPTPDSGTAEIPISDAAEYRRRVIEQHARRKKA